MISSKTCDSMAPVHAKGETLQVITVEDLMRIITR